MFNKKYISIAAVILIVLAGALYLGWQSGALARVLSYFKPEETPGIILFYSKECPHCAIVEEYITANDVESKVEFTQLEVSENQNNLELLAKKALYCKVDLSQGAPIPFLWDGEKCLVGDVDIIQYFQDAISPD